MSPEPAPAVGSARLEGRTPCRSSVVPWYLLIVALVILALALTIFAGLAGAGFAAIAIATLLGAAAFGYLARRRAR